MTDGIAIRHDENIHYPKRVPYDASASYPELAGAPLSDEANTVYEGVRQCLVDLGLDKENMGTVRWTPLADLVKPGNTVVIKPNLVRHADKVEHQECVTTHPSVLRPIIDYCWQAMRQQGKIIVGDAPSTETDFALMCERYGLKRMIEVLQERGVQVELMDFRQERTVMENGIWVDEQPNRQAPESQIVNLGEKSFFYGGRYDHVKLHGGGYEIHETTRHHRGDRQEYCVSKIILHADAVISVPKLKTHKKAGITCCMKNLVGINTNKNFLPHWIQGSQDQGGDEMPALPAVKSFNLRCINFFKEHIQEHGWKYIDRFILSAAKRMSRSKPDARNGGKDTVDYAAWLMRFFLGQPVFGGAWKGNETICRMILDLNQIFLRCDKEGKLQEKTDRKYFYVVDGVTMGQKNGPMNPDPLETHLIAAGSNGLQLDIELIKMLNLDPMEIPLYQMSSQQGEWLTGPQYLFKRFNGEIMDKTVRLPYHIVLPDHWENKM